MCLPKYFLKQKKLPSSLKIDLGKEISEFILDNDGKLLPAEFTKHIAWKWPQRPPTQRAVIYLNIWSRLKILPYHEIKAKMELITNWSGIATIPDDESYPMNPEQLKDLNGNKLFHLGLHTVTHPTLAAHPKHVQEQEIKQCYDDLKSAVPSSKNIIAYPFGNYNEDTITAARALGIKAGFTTEEKAVLHNSDILRLGRFR